MVWKKGVVLRIPTEAGLGRVRLREDDAESKTGLRQLRVKVLGDAHARKFALRRVRDTVEDLHRRWYRNIQVDEMVPCRCETDCQHREEPYLHKLAVLTNLKYNRGKTTAQCGASGDDVPIEFLLEGFTVGRGLKNLSSVAAAGGTSSAIGNQKFMSTSKTNRASKSKIKT